MGFSNLWTKKTPDAMMRLPGTRPKLPSTSPIAREPMDQFCRILTDPWSFRDRISYGLFSEKTSTFSEFYSLLIFPWDKLRFPGAVRFAWVRRLSDFDQLTPTLLDCKNGGFYWVVVKEIIMIHDGNLYEAFHYLPKLGVNQQNRAGMCEYL